MLSKNEANGIVYMYYVVGYFLMYFVKQQLQSVSSGQGVVSRTSSICAPENTSRENNKQGGGEELEPPQPQQPPPPQQQQQQQQKRPTLLRVPSISNQDMSGVNNNDTAYESVSIKYYLSVCIGKWMFKSILFVIENANAGCLL